MSWPFTPEVGSQPNRRMLEAQVCGPPSGDSVLLSLLVRAHYFMCASLMQDGVVPSILDSNAYWFYS